MIFNQLILINYSQNSKIYFYGSFVEANLSWPMLKLAARSCLNNSKKKTAQLDSGQKIYLNLANKTLRN